MSGKGMDLFPEDENSQSVNLANFEFDTGSQSQDTGYQNKNTEAKALFESSSDEEKYSASNKAGYVDEQEKKIFEDPNLREEYKKGLLERLRVLMPDSEFEELQKLTQEYTSEQIDELSQGQSQKVNEVTSFEVKLDDDDLDFNVNEHFSTISPIKIKTGSQNPDTNDVVNDMKSMIPNVIEFASKASSKTLTENNPVDKIVKILNRGGIGVPRSTIRPAITDKIGDAQQMIDMWGKHITDYAKGGEAKCYLCNLKIVPISSCPEMEHKYPVASAYSAMRPYRELKAYIGKKDYANGQQITMYKLWNTYINRQEHSDKNSALRQLYIAINEGVYDAGEVDNKYEKVFDNFWMDTKYGKFWKRKNNKLVIDYDEVKENVTIKVLNHILSLEEDEINTTLERLLKRKQEMPESQEGRTKMLEKELVGLENVKNLEHNQELYNFFYFFIKFWLLEFAYSHHTCNQAKSDYYVFNLVDYSKFMVSARKRTLSKNDLKTGTELRGAYGTTLNLNKKLQGRQDNLVLMFQDLYDTVDGYMTAYESFTEDIQKTFQLNIDNVSETLMYLKALHRIVTYNDMNTGIAKQEEQQRKYEQKKQQEKENIVSLYENLKQVERVILEIESGNQQSRSSERIRLKQLDKNNQVREVALENLRKLLSNYYKEYNEEVSQVNFGKTDTGDGEKISAETEETVESTDYKDFSIREDSQAYFELLEEEVEQYKKEYMEDPLIDEMCENTFESQETLKSDSKEAYKSDSEETYKSDSEETYKSDSEEIFDSQKTYISLADSHDNPGIFKTPSYDGNASGEDSDETNISLVDSVGSPDSDETNISLVDNVGFPDSDETNIPLVGTQENTLVDTQNTLVDTENTLVDTENTLVDTLVDTADNTVVMADILNENVGSYGDPPPLKKQRSKEIGGNGVKRTTRKANDNKKLTKRKMVTKRKY